LFCDLVGFTARSDQADPEDVGAMLRPYHVRLRRKIERFGGTLDKFIGDAVMAVFGAPAAHEDDPERAVRCAARLLEAIVELNATQPALALSVRIGITTGEALVVLQPGGETEGVVGDIVNTASRLQGVAPVNGILVGEGTWRATHALFAYDELAPVRVKGKARPCRCGDWSGHAAASAWTWISGRSPRSSAVTPSWTGSNGATPVPCGNVRCAWSPCSVSPGSARAG
jgi:class 3 adenylate cyclase